MTENEAVKKDCGCRAENGNCLVIGGFCTSVPKEYCVMAIELQQYRSIGTVEECREAVGRQSGKKPNLYGDFEDGKLLCPNCEEDLMDLVDCGFSNCPYCGQRISWEEGED